MIFVKVAQFVAFTKDSVHSACDGFADRMFVRNNAMV